MRTLSIHRVSLNRLSAVTIAFVGLALGLAFSWQQIISADETRIGSNNSKMITEAWYLSTESDQHMAGYEMNPAAAMANDKPTVFFFIPSELCQSQYCLPPWYVESLIKERYAKQVNFITVEVRSLPYDGEPEAYSTLPYANWNLYPIAPFSELLPELSLTDFGLGLESSRVRLVDKDGQLVYETGSAFSADEFMAILGRLMSETS
jgi:hypothetical protein